MLVRVRYEIIKNNEVQKLELLLADSSEFISDMTAIMPLLILFTGLVSRLIKGT